MCGSRAAERHLRPPSVGPRDRAAAGQRTLISEELRRRGRRPFTNAELLDATTRRYR
jgi:hypothetical protein